MFGLPDSQFPGVGKGLGHVSSLNRSITEGKVGPDPKRDLEKQNFS